MGGAQLCMQSTQKPAISSYLKYCQVHVKGGEHNNGTLQYIQVHDSKTILGQPCQVAKPPGQAVKNVALSKSNVHVH